jgi:thiol-disulfide isomerase/thioredoxin
VPVEVVAKDRGTPVDLSGTDLEGKDVDLAALRGKPVVVNVWWSQCPPCRVEQPDLNDAAAELGDQVSFVGLNIRDSSPDGRALLSFSGTLNPRSIPSTVVLDADGRVAASVQGRIPTTQTLVSIVEKVLDE